jgi:hypothetical protein
MHQRLHRALRHASDLRASLVLIVLIILRTRRRFQRRWDSMPGIVEIIEARKRRFNIWFTYYLYKDVHWIKQ